MITFDPFCSALIGALVMSISDSFMLGIRRYLRFDAPLRRFLGRRRSRYPPRGTERLFRRVASSSGFVSSAGLPSPLLAFQKLTGLNQDDAACLDAFDCYRRMHPPDAAIRAVRPSQHLEAAQHMLKRQSLPSSRLQ